MFKSIVSKKSYTAYLSVFLICTAIAAYDLMGIESTYDESVIENLNHKVSVQQNNHKNLKLKLRDINSEKNKFYGKSIDNLAFKKELIKLCRILTARKTLSSCNVNNISSSNKYVNVTNVNFSTGGKKDNLVLVALLPDMYNMVDYAESDYSLVVNFYKKQ